MLTGTIPIDLLAWKRHRALLVLVFLAVALGILARFKGLGSWPLGVDEYYLAQSVKNILRFGLPAYECGGWYVRGLLLQYLTAGLQLLGVSAELAPRSIAAVASLAVLPAAFVLGRRVNNTTTGLLVVILLAISAWQIEMGRFGRFYAPFQAIFLWYMICFVRYTVDGRRDSAWGMALLATLSALVWEGGVLLAATSLLPALINHDGGRLKAVHWRYLLVMGGLLLLLHAVQRADFRIMEGALPENFEDISSRARPGPEPHPVRLLAILAGEPVWLLAGLLPLGASIWALGFIARYRDQWLTAVGLLVALVAVLLGHTLVFVAVIALLMLLRLLEWRDLSSPRGVPYLAASSLAITFWIAVSLVYSASLGDSPESIRDALPTLIQRMAGFPNVIDMIARPWGRAIPMLGLSLFVALACSAAWVIFTDSPGYRLERALLIVLIVLILLIGAASSPRLETRYSFFLYPLLLINAICLILRLVQFIARRPHNPTLLGTAIVLGWFAMTEDFRPQHLATIDSAETIFRVGMSSAEASHYYPRSDSRATAEWLLANASLPEDLVISGPGIASLDFYYSGLEFVYVDPSDHRLADWSCRGGTVERWTNLPLIYSFTELTNRITARQRSFLVIDSLLMDKFLPRLADLEPRVAWENPYGNDAVVIFDRVPHSDREPADANVAPSSLP